MPIRQGSRGALADGANGSPLPGETETFFLRVIDYALAAALCGLPFLMGGRSAAGYFALALIAAVAAIAMAGVVLASPRAVRWPRIAFGLIAAALALPVIQLVPWPQPVLDRIAPHIQELLPAWQGETALRLGLPRWSTVSLAPAETRGALVVFLSHAILFAAAVVRIRRVERIERILRWCAMVAVLMAAFGLVQFTFASGDFYWIYSNPFSTTADTVKGSFTNRNHFAGFLALGIGPLVWWLASLDGSGKHRQTQASSAFSIPTDSRTWMRAAMLGLVGAAATMSLSRGGILAVVLALCIATVLMLRVHAGGRNLLCGLTAVGLLTVGAWTVCGGKALDARVETIASGSAEALDENAGRRCVWSGVLRAIPEFLPFGSGAGSFRAAAPLFVEDPYGDLYEYTHAESSYLQIAMETGLVGLLLGTGGILLAAAWCVRGFRRGESQRMKACAAAVAASLAVFALHGAVDVIWHVPACSATAAVLAACAWAAATLQAERRAPGTVALRPRTPARWAAFGGIAAAACMGGWMIADRWGPLLSEPAWELHQRLLLGAADKRGAAEDKDGAQNRIAILSRAAQAEPDNARVHAALAEEHLVVFEQTQQQAANAMTLRNIRDAAVRAKFADVEALDAWLARSVGENRAHLDQAVDHALLAMKCSPLEGRAYACLAQAAFLRWPSDPDAASLINQALIARPREGSVLYAAANEAAFQGDHARWTELVRRTMQCGPTWRGRVIVNLFAAAPRESLFQMAREFVEAFQPDLDGLRLLSRFGLDAQPDCCLPFLDRPYGEAAVRQAKQLDGTDAAAVWLEAAACYTRLGEAAPALECAKRAYFAAPENFSVRCQYGFALAEQGAWEEAEEHLRWCAERRPGNMTIQRLYKESLAQRILREAAARDARPISRRGV